jgi:hypothetical protein
MTGLGHCQSGESSPNPDMESHENRSRTTQPTNHRWTLMNTDGFLGDIYPAIVFIGGSSCPFRVFRAFVAALSVSGKRKPPATAGGL